MMNIVVQIEHRASSRWGKHEGESSFGLCDRLSRTRDNSQRQLPTDQDYAVPTREYQTDQSSLKTAPTSGQKTQSKTWLVRSLCVSCSFAPYLYLHHRQPCMIEEHPSSRSELDAAR